MVLHQIFAPMIRVPIQCRVEGICAVQWAKCGEESCQLVTTWLERFTCMAMLGHLGSICTLRDLPEATGTITLELQNLDAEEVLDYTPEPTASDVLPSKIEVVSIRLKMRS